MIKKTITFSIFFLFSMVSLSHGIQDDKREVHNINPPISPQGGVGGKGDTQDGFFNKFATQIMGGFKISEHSQIVHRLKEIELLIFDCDGTLLDTLPFHYAS